MSDRKKLGVVLRALGDALLEMSDADFDALVRGAGRFTFVRDSERTKAVAEREDRPCRDRDIGQLARALDTAPTREAARELLSAEPKASIEVLRTLARQVKVHVEKRSSRDEIEQRIIEATVGARLKSEAILGLNLKGATGTGQGSATTKGNDET